MLVLMCRISQELPALATRRAELPRFNTTATSLVLASSPNAQHPPSSSFIVSALFSHQQCQRRTSRSVGFTVPISPIPRESPQRHGRLLLLLFTTSRCKHPLFKLEEAYTDHNVAPEHLPIEAPPPQLFIGLLQQPLPSPAVLQSRRLSRPLSLRALRLPGVQSYKRRHGSRYDIMNKKVGRVVLSRSFQ